MFEFWVKLTGDFVCNYYFKDEASMKKWKWEVLPGIKIKYRKLKTRTKRLPKLKVGDTCQVYGEGETIFTINGIHRYEDHRFGFILNTGDVEEISNCYSL